MSELIGVVLVNWNGGEYTLECIRSLKGGEYMPDLIVVVDNSSTDDSVTIIKERYADVIVIENASNLGFAEANNIGIRYLNERNVAYVWLLNNDTYVDVDCLKYLHARCSNNCSVAVSGKIYMEDGRVWYDGGFRSPITGVACNIGICNQRMTRFLSGCCIFANIEIFRRTGGFLSQYVAYSEDSEWCLRAEKAGVRLEYEERSVLCHKVSASVKKNSHGDTLVRPLAWYLLVRNHMWTLRIHFFGIRFLFYVGVYFIIQFRHLVRALFRARWREVMAVALGLYDGALGGSTGAVLFGVPIVEKKCVDIC